MTDFVAFDNPLLGNASPPETAVVDRRLARVAAAAASAAIFAAIAYWRESGLFIYGILFAIPYAAFVLARSSGMWRAWGWALAWTTIALAIVPTAVTAVAVIRHAHRSEIAPLVFLLVLLFTQVAQLVFVRRTFPGTIAFGRPLFRAVLYYLCWLLVVAATLPNWYVPPIVRRENQAVDTLHKYSAVIGLYATTSKNAGYPPKLSALDVPVEAGKIPVSGVLDSELMCAQASCVQNGYRFEYRPVFKAERVASYTISARPLEFEETGNRSFLLTADGKVYQTREDRDARLSDTERW